ncbi:MAG: DUF5687 family protein [Ignavibacteriales bacterium]|nr:DUF5687 family protein [Ignavibacteriales bacterium]
MTLWLFQHQWKSIRRSSDFRSKVAANIIFGLLMLIVALEFLLLGFFLDRILSRNLPPGSDSVDLVDGVLVFYFGIDFILRLFFQKLRSITARQYVLQPVSRKRIAHFVLVKTMGTAVNFLPLFILIPFFFTGVLRIHPFLASTAWLVSLLSLLVFNTFLANYSKMKFFTHPIQTVLAVGVLVAIVLLEKFQVLSFELLSAQLFGSVLHHPFLAAVPLLASAAIYGINLRFLIDHLYLEDLVAGGRAKSFREHFPLLGGFGEIGTLISLDLKLMMRNKRARISLWMPFLMVFYGLLFYRMEHFNIGSAFTEFMLIFVGTFITGFFIMSYGLTTFCYESRHFSLILTNRIDMFIYLKARYYLMLLVTTLVYILSLFYIYFGMRVFVVNSLMFLFNIGCSTFYFLYLSTFNKSRFDLSGSVFSTQGKGANQFVAIFVLMIVVAVPFLTLQWLIGGQAGLLGLGVLGVLGFVFHNQILVLLTRQFERRKYIMAEGFRQL